MPFPHPSEPRHVVIQPVTTGDHTVVAAEAGQKIRPTAISVFSKNGPVGIYLHDGVTSFAGNAAIPLPLDPTGVDGYQAFIQAENSGGHFETGAGLPLLVNQDANYGICVQITYVLVAEGQTH